MKQFSTPYYTLYYTLIINLSIISCLSFLISFTMPLRAKTESLTQSLLISEPVNNAFKIRPPGLNSAQKVSGESPGIITHAYYDVASQFPAYDDLLLGPAPSRIFGNKGSFFLSTTGSYNRSINSTAITQTLFGNTLLGDSCNSLLIQGSLVDNRNPKALLADYFYLPDTYESVISFNPTITTNTVNVNLYAQSNTILPGFYARLNIPYVHAQWNLCAQEHRISSHDNNDDNDNDDHENNDTVEMGRFSPLEVSAENLLPDALSFFAGFTPGPFIQTGVIGDNPDADYPIIREGLLFPLFNPQDNRAHGLSEIRYEVGYDFWQAENSHFGLYFTGAIPSFTHKKQCSLFHPITDNGNHVEIGAGLTGHHQMWQSQSENQRLSICADAQITHLCSANELRSFDLKNKPLSRYMLAAKHTPVSDGGLNELSGSVQRQGLNATFDLGPHKAGFQFDNLFAPIGNLTAQQVSVSINAQIDATIWLNYIAHGFTVDLGYNIWLQTTEKITCSPMHKSRLENEPYWAIHGDALVFSYFSLHNGVVNPESRGKALAIAASQSGATIQTGTNAHAQGLPIPKGGQESFPETPAPTIGQLNGGIDYPQFASATDTQNKASWLSNTNNYPIVNQDPIRYGPEAQTRRQTMLSVDPIFLSPSDVLINPKQSHMSHKLFGAVGYTFNCYHINPYIGIGGEIEFGSHTTYNTQTNHLNYAVSKWGGWVKIGLSF